MKHDDLERMLSGEQEIVPSSGFVNSVMEAVRREAATPPPTPFPWKLTLPGLIVAVLALGWVFVKGMDLFPGALAARSHPELFRSAFPMILEAANTIGAGWIALALILSLASVQVGIRLAAWKT